MRASLENRQAPNNPGSFRWISVFMKTLLLVFISLSQKRGKESPSRKGVPLLTLSEV